MGEIACFASNCKRIRLPIFCLLKAGFDANETIICKLKPLIGKEVDRFAFFESVLRDVELIVVKKKLILTCSIFK